MNTPRAPIRVLCVDDSAYNRKVLRSIIAPMPEVESVETVSDGEDAIKSILASPPSIVTLDLNMPRMDGFTFLRWLMRTRPLPVLVISAEGDEKSVFKALDLGALDFVVKPTRHASERIFEVREEIVEKIRAIASKDLTRYLEQLSTSRPSAARTFPVRPFAARPDAPGLLVIGASTGGPSAIQSVLASIEAPFPLAVVVVQHMPAVFTRQFAQRLDRCTSFSAREAEEGDTLAQGTVLVAPGGYHVVLSREGKGQVSLREKREGDRFVPSVDVTMDSAAALFGARTLGVLLTGMGDDGANGLLAIRKAGGRTIAESAETCVVYGMPRAAAARGAAEDVLPLDKIPARVSELARAISGLKNGRMDAT
jgi:two-component system, chemotaxis family, protein-glutamate methylesterase/glutaminase